MQTAFITDGLLRKTLSATRSLGSNGIKTIVGEKSILNPSGFSKFCSKRVLYPNPTNNPNLFFNWLLNELQKEKNPVLIPMDDAVLEVVIQHQSELKKYCKCLLPKRKAFEVASDKYETMKLAKQQGIDSPETILPNNQNDLKEIANHLTYPVIIKPRKSSGSRGIRKVNTREELIESFSKIHLDFQSPMIQEFIPLGDRYDVCLIYNRNNEVKASFVQREVRHFPIEMGPSTVQESVEYQELIERSIQLLQPLKWVGIVEVEFMIDPRTNEPKLMEINPRFWNSLDLAVQSGVDFPHLFYKLSLEEQVTNIRDYKVGMKSRWLIPGDVLHFLYNKKRFEMNPPLLSGKKSLVIDDTFSMSDPMPGLVFILACVRFALSFQSLKLFIKR